MIINLVRFELYMVIYYIKKFRVKTGYQKIFFYLKIISK